MNHPNILWISFEDTYPYYGCYGDPVARPPQMIVLGPHAHGDALMPEPGGTVRGPAILQLQSATQGASISYGLGDEAPCRLYVAPLRLPPGRTRIRAVANRIGYRDSAVIEAVYETTE